jgi:hypothetical protein
VCSLLRFDERSASTSSAVDSFVVWNVESGARGSIQLLALGVSLVPGSTLPMRILLLPVRVSAIVSLLPESSLKSCLLRTLNSYHRGKTSPAKIRLGLDLQPSDRLAFQASFIEFLLIDHEFDIFSD